MKILVTGGSGLLGGKLLRVLNRRHDVVGTYLREEKADCIPLDITDAAAVAHCVAELRPDVVIHTAAIADPDTCERSPDVAWRVNVEGARHIAAACAHAGTRLVHVSTDYVFDGEAGGYREDAEARPVNRYGVTKLEAERAVRAELAGALILRIPILYGFNDENDRPIFATQVAGALRGGRAVQADDAQLRYPVLTDDVAELLEALIEREVSGIVHFASPEPTTKLGWARTIARALEEDSALGEDSTLEEDRAQLTPAPATPSRAPRPKDTRLEDTRLEALGIDVRPSSLADGTTRMCRQMTCSFRVIYNMKPDMLVSGTSASALRMELGRALARQHPIDADYVVGIPESGIFPATGYAMASGVPFCYGILRDYFTARTLFQASLEARLAAIRRKLIVVPDILRGKRVVLIDEAIISGATLSVVIERLRDAGVASVHVRIPSPLMRASCGYGVLNADARLIARAPNARSQDTPPGDARASSPDLNDRTGAIAKALGCDTLAFLDLSTFSQLVGASGAHCFECFEEPTGC